MIITGSGAVAFPVGAASRKQPGLSDDRFIPGLARLADAVHEAGSLLCVQMSHHGKSARVAIADDRPVLLPSAPKGRPDPSSLQDNTAAEGMALAPATGGNIATHPVAAEHHLDWATDPFDSGARRTRPPGTDHAPQQA